MCRCLRFESWKLILIVHTAPLNMAFVLCSQAIHHSRRRAISDGHTTEECLYPQGLLIHGAAHGWQCT